MARNHMHAMSVNGMGATPYKGIPAWEKSSFLLILAPLQPRSSAFRRDFLCASTMTQPSLATPMHHARKPRFTNVMKPPVPTATALSGFFNEALRKSGSQAPVLSSEDPLQQYAPHYLQAPGEIQRFAMYFENNAFADPDAIPGGTVYNSQIMLGELRSKSKKLSKRTPPTVACNIIAKIISKFLPEVFPASMEWT